MCEVFEAGLQKIRVTHTPALFHVEELTQPQGHSTSGSHERYKSPERLEWERAWDAMKKMKEWIIENALASEEELEEIQTKAKDLVRNSKNSAWEKCMAPIHGTGQAVLFQLIRELVCRCPGKTGKTGSPDPSAGCSAGTQPAGYHASPAPGYYCWPGITRQAASLRAYYQELIRRMPVYTIHIYIMKDAEELKILNLFRCGMRKIHRY